MKVKVYSYGKFDILPKALGNATIHTRIMLYANCLQTVPKNL